MIENFFFNNKTRIYFTVRLLRREQVVLPVRYFICFTKIDFLVFLLNEKNTLNYYNKCIVFCNFQF